MTGGETISPERLNTLTFRYRPGHDGRPHRALQNRSPMPSRDRRFPMLRPRRLSAKFAKRLTENEFSDFRLLCHDGCADQATRHNVWTKITRPKYERAGQRYASDLTDAEWAVIEPHMPVAKPLGRPRGTDLRAVVDAILYMARTGCQWRLRPKDFPPFYFYDWRDSGLFERINFELLVEVREAGGREASPSLPR